MNKMTEITTTDNEIIIRIPRRMFEIKKSRKVNINSLRGLMRHSRYAKQGSVTAQHAAWRTISTT